VLLVPRVGLFLAGKAFRAYRARGGIRTSLLPDFLIGAHATVAGLSLLTRDVARYRTYFPAATLIVP
jgi:predicted nucleic acid-binding protein